jgi:hypothetical protein
MVGTAQQSKHLLTSVLRHVAADTELLLQKLAIIAWSLHGVCGLITANVASMKGRNPAVAAVKVSKSANCAGTTWSLPVLAEPVHILLTVSSQDRCVIPSVCRRLHSLHSTVNACAVCPAGYSVWQPARV